MQRRVFIRLLGGAAATSAWPSAARAQQPVLPTIGFLNVASHEAFGAYVTAFRQGLGQVGYFEGRNVSIEFRWARGQYDRLATLASELVGQRVAIIAANGGARSALDRISGRPRESAESVRPGARKLDDLAPL